MAYRLDWVFDSCTVLNVGRCHIFYTFLLGLLDSFYHLVSAKVKGVIVGLGTVTFETSCVIGTRMGGRMGSRNIVKPALYI